METRNYWEENGHAVKFENYNSSDGFSRTAASSEQLGFTPPSEDEADYQAPGYLKKGKQDPMSHRIIEKRRRDRMNNCLADLSRLIPLEYLKKGRGRVEKTEIIEMAIRHIKFLQERANGLYQTNKGKPAYEDKPSGDLTEHYRAGFQEAVAEAVRFLVEAQGYAPGDGLCVQIASHLHRHCEHMTKGDHHIREKARPQLGNSSTASETASSSSSSQGYALKAGGVIARTAPHPDPPRYCDPAYELVAVTDPAYPMECDRVPAGVISVAPDELEAPFPDDELDMGHKSESTLQGPHEPALHGARELAMRGVRDSTLRGVRKLDHNDDYLHSYKFKNSIERRFSRSQDCEVHDMSMKSSGPHGKVYSHKRRRALKPPPCASTSTTSNSGSTEDAVDTSPQDTSSESPHHHYEKPALPSQQFVPVFALNALGKYYVPLSVEYSCLMRHLGPHDVLDSRASSLAAPLHPVTIHVNFQPCLNYQVKRERDPSNCDWRAL